MDVRSLLAVKGSAIWSIGPDETVYQALVLMEEKNVGALLVMQGERLVGIFTERNYAREIIIKGRFSKDTKVREVMTQKVHCVNPERTVDECMALMTSKRVRHLPVFRDKKLIGLISIGDVVKSLIDEQAHTIDDLYHYIYGTF